MGTLLRRTIAAAVVLLLAAPQISAQTNLPLLGFSHGVGARALGMGGAYVGLANDYSATFWNPAGLGQIRRMELTGAFNALSYENNTTYFGSALDDKSTFSNLNNLGFVYPVPTYRGSLVLAIGYNRVANYDSHFAIDGFNSNAGDSVRQVADQLDRGGLRQWSFAGAVQMSRELYLGGALNVYTGDYDYSYKLTETDNLDIWQESTWLYEDDIQTKISGVGLTLAALYNLNNRFRFGASLETPVTLKGEEDWHTYERVDYDDNTFADTTFAGVYDYKVRRPLTFNLGASYSLPLLTLSGDISLTDWSQLEYTEPNELNDENRSFRRDLQATTRYRLGAELIVPNSPVRLRGGYARDPSPYKNGTQYSDKEFITGGVGLLLDRQFMLDLGVVYGKWELANPGALQEEIKTFNTFVSVSYRF